MKRWIVLLGLLMLFSNPAYAADGDTWTAPAGIGTDAWRVTSTGDLLPGTTNTYDFGSASLYPKTIYLGGVGKTSWGSVISPMTDAATYVNPTDAGNYLRLYDAGYIRLGDATNAGDYYVLYTGDSDAWYAGQYDSTNDFVIGYGSTVGTDIRFNITDDANTTTVTLGDGVDSYDKALIFDGNAYDFYMAYDDSADDLLIGVGSTIGTTPAISITDGQVISTYADITMTGTTPTLTVGDAGAEDAGFVFDGNAQDYYIALDDSADDLIIGLGSTVGTTPIIAMEEAYGITTYGDITMTGTTPLLTVGDGGTEDNQVLFDGVTDFAIGVDHSRSVFEINNGADMDATTAISISTDEDVTLDAGSLYIIDDEFVYWGTNSDFKIEYDEAVDDQVLFLTTTTGATATTDPLFEFLVPTTPTADQQVFGVAKGTQASNTALFTLDEDGDVAIAGTTTSTGLITGSAGLTVTGAAVNLNASSNFAVNVGTGSTTAAVTIGGNSNTVAVNSSDWDISTAGAMTNINSVANTSADLALLTTTSGNITLTTAAAAAAVYVVDGNLSVGNGVPSVIQNGEDTYLEGTLEVDGATTLDGALTVAGATTLTGAATLSSTYAQSLATANPFLLTTTLATASTAMKIYGNNDDITAQQYLLALDYDDDGDADADFIICRDNQAADSKFSVSQDGDTVVAGTLGVTGVTTLSGATTQTGALTINNTAAISTATANPFSVTSTLATASTACAIYNTNADVTAQQYLLDLKYTDNNDTDADFIRCIDDAGVNADSLFSVDSTGLVTAAGGVTSTGTLTATATLNVGGDFQVNDGANKPNGTAVFANATDSVTITNSLIDSGSRIFLTVNANLVGTVGRIYANDPGSGSVVLGSSGNETADFNVWYLIVND